MCLKFYINVFRYVTIEQKEFFIHFAKENPELVAHKPNFKLRVCMLLFK